MTAPFRFRFRVRYSECDAQGIVFNARWGDYVDLAVGEYTRAVFDQDHEFRLRKQTIEWHAPARFDDVLDISVHTAKIGTTSFTIGFSFTRGDVHLASAETVYVFVDNAANKSVPIPDAVKASLARGAPGIVVDQSAASPRR
jgi:acyl-CoA thioester hydrolase